MLGGDPAQRVRDSIDVAALGALLGPAGAKDALRDFYWYRDVCRSDAARDVSPLLQLVRRLAQPKPADLAITDVPRYNGIVQA